jgi:hypothetical protein
MAKKKAKPKKGERSVPPGDRQFHIFQGKVMTKTKANMIRWNINQQYVLDVLTPLQIEWEAAWDACKDRHTTTQDMRIRKNQARAAYEKALRIHIGGLQNNPDVTVADLEEMDIAVKRGGFHEKKKVTDTKPIMEFDTSKPGQLGYVIKEEGAEDSTAMPENSGSIEVCSAHLDHQPANVGELTEVTTIYQTTAIYHYPLSKKGEVVYFMCRWVSPTGEKGPWSEVYRVVLP